ncbi:MAG: UvrD-helicase domain-containing protein [Myxococcota bacterium]|nr:UvrD-helicase domain-containing protein [Myxococcota bacterium]
MTDYDHLNPEQRQAVMTTDGPLLVLAGAGSGKTRVITYRIAHLIESGVSPANIVALSFTNKAANEMKERVLELVGVRARHAVLSTFHALGLRFLKEEYEHAGLMKGFTILDEGDQVAAVRDIIVSLGFDPKVWDPKLVHHRMSDYKSRFQRPDGRGGGIDGLAAQVAPLYGRRLRVMNAVDFDDLISVPVWLLAKNQDLAYRWSGRFQYIMVDEYQDTNASQLKFLKGLANRHGNVCAVGDDDQSIYGWRGAEAGNILRFDQHFPGAKMIALTQNYRSTNGILKAANALIAHNQDRYEKTLWSRLGDGEGLRYLEADDGAEEARWVSTHQIGHKRKHETNWSDYAILYRTNAQARLLEDAIRQLKVPYKIVGGTRFYDRKEVRDLTAYLRVIANPWDETAYRRIINFPARGIGDQTIQKLGAVAQDKQMPFFRVIESPDLVPGLGPSIKDTLRSLDGLFADFRQQFAARERSFGQICRALITRIDFRNAFARTDREIKRVAMRLEHLEEMCNALDHFEQMHPESRLDDYLSSVLLDRQREDENEEDEQLVSLMTLHSSKGLEFPVVYFVGFEEGFLPHTRNPSRGRTAATVTPTEVEEERRLAYVGLTRAKRTLTLTSARRRLRFGKAQARKPSRFLYQIPESLFEGDRSGQLPELSGEALQNRGREAFAQMLEWVKGD